MKILIILGLAALLAGPTQRAEAYNSAVPDPKNATDNLGREIETKLIVKSAVGGASQALVPGVAVSYDSNTIDGYTVTRAVPQTLVGHNQLACVTIVDTATGDTQYHPCISKGVAFMQYDGTIAQRALVAGLPACVKADGVLRGCALTTNEATWNTGIIPLKSATDSGALLPVLINLQ